jgi:hypothetical protein
MINPIHYWGTAWFIINGQRYSEGNYYDMIDWVYDDDVEIRGINTNCLSRSIKQYICKLLAVLISIKYISKYTMFAVELILVIVTY